MDTTHHISRACLEYVRASCMLSAAAIDTACVVYATSMYACITAPVAMWVVCRYYARYTQSYLEPLLPGAARGGLFRAVAPESGPGQDG